MTHNNNYLFVSDNLSKIYAIDLNDGKVIWSKKNQLPFNSLIKLFDNKIFVVDANNNLNCFSSKDGSLIWQHKTEKSFINSSKKLSILIKDNTVIFSNSLGDITALNISNGSLIWQKFTLNSKIYEEIMTLKMSNLIIDNDSIYFSNNRNKFYSIDFNTGITNWVQEINSNVKPAVIGNFIFTISLDGYFFIIEKNTGNILRISNIFTNLKKKKSENIYPVGFIFNFQNLFVSTSNGKIIIVDIKTANTENILKVNNGIISRPIVHDQKMYVIKDNSIIKFN
jgi:outer membrane protein assembly factor BamB